METGRWWAWWAMCATWRWRRIRSEMYMPIRQCQDWGSVDVVVRSTLPLPVLSERVEAALRPLIPSLPKASAAADTLGRSRHLSAAIHCAAADRFRHVRPGAGVAGNLRRSLVLGDAANAGDRHSYGAGSAGGASAAADRDGDAGARNDRAGDWNGSGGGGGARDQRVAVRRDLWGPVHFPGSGGGDAGSGRAGGLLAGAQSFAD